MIFHDQMLINKNQCIMKKCQVFTETAAGLSTKVNKWLMSNEINIICMTQGELNGWVVLTIIYEEKEIGKE